MILSANGQANIEIYFENTDMRSQWDTLSHNIETHDWSVLLRRSELARSKGSFLCQAVYDGIYAMVRVSRVELVQCAHNWGITYSKDYICENIY